MRRTGSGTRILLATLIAGVLLPVQVEAVGPDDPDPQKTHHVSVGRRIGRVFAIGFDVAVVRPLSACATIIGAGLFVPVFLISAAGGTEARDEALEIFVMLPAKSVYERPLGEF